MELPFSVSPSGMKFLNSVFSSGDDVQDASSIGARLEKECCDMESDISQLTWKLMVKASFWETHFRGMKDGFDSLNTKLIDYCRKPDADVATDEKSRRMREIVMVELPMLAKVVGRINLIRSYAEMSLKLETLIGDLEDTVYTCVAAKNGKRFSMALGDAACLDDVHMRLEKMELCPRILKCVEDVLLDIYKTRPQWRRLVSAVDSRIDKALTFLRTQAIADHRAILSTIRWPPPLTVVTKDQMKNADLPNPLVFLDNMTKQTYSQSFLLLCALQQLQIMRQARQAKKSKTDNVNQLWTIEELVYPIASRAERHFLKWVDEPEFIFALAYKITRDYIGSLDDTLQPLVDKARILGFSVREAWVSAMVEMLATFIKGHLLPVLADKLSKNEADDVCSSWLYLLDLIISYNTQMQALVYPTGLGPEGLLKVNTDERVSLLQIFCDRVDWFHLWCEMELLSAKGKLQNELINDSIWAITSGQEKVLESLSMFPSKEDRTPDIAVVVTGIVLSLIDRSQCLPTIPMQLQFIRSTASEILLLFIDVLYSRCSEIQGDAVLDYQGMLKVVQTINAARHCDSVIREWSEDVKFVELKLSECVSQGQSKKNVDPQSSIFDYELEELKRFETEWLAEIIAFILRQFDFLSSSYTGNKSKWSICEGSNVDEDVSSISEDLLAALGSLQDGLAFFSKMLNSKDFLDLWRSVAGGLDHFIFSNIALCTLKFSKHGIQQFIVDMNALFSIFKSYCYRPKAFFPCIRDSLVLLSMTQGEARCKLDMFSSVENNLEFLRSIGVVRISSAQTCKILRNMTLGG